MTLSPTHCQRSAFTLVEIILSLLVLTFIMGVVSFPLQKKIQKYHFDKQVRQFKDQLQLSYDLVLHCDVPIEMIIKNESTGLSVEWKCPNAFVDAHLPQKKIYTHIGNMRVNHQQVSDTIFSFSFFSDSTQEKLLTVENKNVNSLSHVVIKGHPYVLEAFKLP